MARSNIWPGPGSGASVSTSLKLSGIGSARGRETRRIWRFLAAVMVAPLGLYLVPALPDAGKAIACGDHRAILGDIRKWLISSENAVRPGFRRARQNRVRL